MLTNRFSFFNDDQNDDRDGGKILSRVSSLTIRLERIREYHDDETGETEPGGIFGSFKLSGGLGTVGENASPEDLAFVRELLAKFEAIAK